jgi:hypothetical protein
MRCIEALLSLGDANLEALCGVESFDAVVDIVGGAQFGSILNCL